MQLPLAEEIQLHPVFKRLDAAEQRIVVDACVDFWRFQAALGEDQTLWPTPSVIVEWQAAEALLVASGYVRPVTSWPWARLERLVGPIMAGDVIVVAARTGEGKSTFISNLLFRLAAIRGGVKMAVATLEQRAAVFQTKMACLELGLDVAAYFRERWDRLGVDGDVAQRRVRRLVRQHREPGRRIEWWPEEDMDRARFQWFVGTALGGHARLLIVDHIHHMDHGGSRPEDFRATLKLAKKLANRYDVSILFTAQIGRADKRDRRRKFYPPDLDEIQNSSAIEQIADTVMLLYGPLADGTKLGDIDEVILGSKRYSDVVKTDRMAVKCGKHRLDGVAARSDPAELAFQQGLINDDPINWNSYKPAAESRGDAWEE